jgi:hypothetical protein
MPLSDAASQCLTKYGCACIAVPLDSHVLGPFVEMSFNGQGGTTITVGNRSSAPNNSAIIKSFQYGQSDGVGAEVEIYDEEGGAFERFVEKIAKTPDETLELYKAQVRWGWIMQDCDGKITKNITPRTHTFCILSVDINFSGKGIIFKLEMQDLLEPMFETRVNEVYKLPIKEAIKEMFKTSKPKIEDVRFLRYKNQGAALGAGVCYTSTGTDVGGVGSINLSSGDFEELKLKGRAESEPSEWKCNQQSPLAAAREWIGNYVSERDDKGIVVFFDNTDDKPKLVFLEDPLPKCFTDDPGCNRSIGTYIVNGGKHSSVLSFDPKIKFNFSYAARATVAVGSQNVKAEAGKGQPCPPGDGGSKEKGMGSAGMVQVTEDMNRLWGKKEAAVEGNAAQAAHERANKTYENIEAELRIQGDPRLDDPFAIKIRTVSIIVINPFHLVMNQGNSDCPDWLVRPPCNEILSNKNWFCSGVSHEIKEGSFTTTLKLFLPAPGDNLSPP